MSDDFIVIPPDEFGPGCRLDIQNNRLIGASGAIYENVRVNIDDLMRAFPPPVKH